MPELNLIPILTMIAVVASAIIAGSLFPSGKSSIVVTSTVGGNASSALSDKVGDNMTGINTTNFDSLDNFDRFH